MKRNLFGETVADDGRLLGCESCPLNKIPGVRKILGLNRIKGRRAMLWAQSPDRNENKKGLELVGQAGQLLWAGLATVGLTREDFDIQNVLRCWPIDRHGIEHIPTKEELQSCSVYNEESLQRNRGKAVVHLILGDVAGRQLLGKGLFKKDKPIFWYEPWEAYVVLNWHPSFVLRKGGANAKGLYEEWCTRFRAVRAVLDHPGKYGYVRAQPYYPVFKPSEFRAMEKHLRKEAAAGRRVSVDIETGKVDGKTVPLLIGFGVGKYKDLKQWDSWKGCSYSVVLDHPEAKHSRRVRQELVNGTAAILEDRSIEKTLQNGSFDDRELRKLIGTRLRGYTYDTQYGTYLRYSWMQAFGLEAQSTRFLPEFCGYKDMARAWGSNYADAPLDDLVPYNGADCDITKRLECLHAPYISLPLLQVYIHAAYTLDSMETRGPWLDWEKWEEAQRTVPKLLEEVDRHLAQVANRPDFNPSSAPQVAWLLYDCLKLPDLSGTRGTGKDILELLTVKTNNPVPGLIVKRRALAKIKNTYLDGYALSAKKHGGQLHTIWWLTGAVTGRLRSGRGDKGEEEGIINFQNLHGNPLLLNLLVSDLNWRKAL